MNLDRRKFIQSAAAAGLGTAALSRFALAQDDTIVVGSKDFTEQFIVANMYIQVLENAGYSVEDSLNLGGTQVAHQALESGDISLYPEYTGTGLTEVLGIAVEDVDTGDMDEATPETDASAEATPETSTGGMSEAVFNRVQQEYQSQFELTWLERSPANNTQALAVKREFSEENGIVTVSDLAAVAGEYIISAPADFPEREDGLLGLQRVYGEGFEDIEVLPVAPGLKYQALMEDQAQVVLAFGTDGQISGNDLVILEDDQSLWPPYNLAPVVRMEVLEANADIADLLNAVTTMLTDEVLSGLNWRVDGDEHAEPSDVANEWLTENGLLG